jgi:2,3-bisphosphoglycerate-independent phosphoglycerate mutase
MARAGENAGSGESAGNAEAAEFLRELMLSARDFLAGHPVNVARRARGQREANMAWIWGQGTRPEMPSFESRFGVRGAMLTPVDLLRGIAALIGWDRLEPPGMTSYHDNDYAMQGRWACDAIDRYDIVCCHVESPDEASHQGDWRTKVAGIEAIDREVVAPIVAKLRSLSPKGGAGSAGAGGSGGSEGWRLMILPDHYTLVSTRKHDATPVPVLLAGQGFASPRPASAYTEAEAAGSDLHIAKGHELMEFFLRHALPERRRG